MKISTLEDSVAKAMLDEIKRQVICVDETSWGQPASLGRVSIEGDVDLIALARVVIEVVRGDDPNLEE